MKFEELIEKGEVRRAFQDISLIKALVKTAKADLEYLNELEINEKSSRKIVVGYYDVLRSILEAIASFDGYKIYSHEAFTYFLKEKDEEVLSIKFDRFRKIRNSISYYGKNISVEETKENVEEIKNITDILINKYLRGVYEKK